MFSGSFTCLDCIPRYSDSLPLPSNPWCLPWVDFERKQAHLKELGVGGTLRRMP